MVSAVEGGVISIHKKPSYALWRATLDKTEKGVDTMWKVNVDGVAVKGKHDLPPFGAGDTLLFQEISCRVLSFTQSPPEVWLKKL